jgi:hypothetical protein
MHLARELSISWQVMKMHQARYRAVITLDPAKPPAPLHPPVLAYQNHTRALVVRARPLHSVGSLRAFPAEICWDSEQPLHPGDRAWVTITVTGDNAGAYLDAGQRFDLWSGDDVGHGLIALKVFTEYSPA